MKKANVWKRKEMEAHGRSVKSFSEKTAVPGPWITVTGPQDV